MIRIGEKALNKFRTALLLDKNPSLSKSLIRSRLYTALNSDDIFAKVAQSLLEEERDTKTLRCLRCKRFGHVASTCNVRLPKYNRPRQGTSNQSRYSKNFRGAASHRCQWRRAAQNDRIPIDLIRRPAGSRLHPVLYFAYQNNRPRGSTFSTNGVQIWYH
ncbi:putative structural maintenance of chromosome protein 4 [Trypanosoma theileri]|uniref:Putative structural maintenance of chromosome protein 4 n=1 Tax=Trypanosoma theileri TaxID=67003 RepID=A0A1X0NS96_9TRYP|nr:putative structural maintenance of chromosome protein 4 [Trypanosoma theileri]ORC87572.1 putative structural maintenance of chromosome protein 4 [Trypanosoma theileri]